VSGSPIAGGPDVGAAAPTCEPRAASGPPVVLLDRDGVLDELVRDPVSGLPESPLHVRDVRLVEGAAAAAACLARAGFRLACVSNQPAAAKGRASVAQLLAVHARVAELLARDGVRLDALRLCLHHPDGTVPALSGPCPCRKPAPGMLLGVAAELGVDARACWMVGDTDADVAAGRAAGCRTALIEYPGSVHKRLGRAHPDLTAASLDDAVARLLALGDPGGRVIRPCSISSPHESSPTERTSEAF
jgi:D-glycero-D-manno-heptose 1,7-bisphosphate phosphatase